MNDLEELFIVAENKLLYRSAVLISVLQVALNGIEFFFTMSHLDSKHKMVHKFL